MEYPKYKITIDALNNGGIEFEQIHHGIITTVEEGLAFLGIEAKQGVSTLIYRADDKFISVLRRDDHQIDSSKIKKPFKISNLKLITRDEVKELTQCDVGYVSPYNPTMETLMDESIFEIDYIYLGTGHPEYDLKITPENLQKFTNAKKIDLVLENVIRETKTIIDTGKIVKEYGQKLESLKIDYKLIEHPTMKEVSEVMLFLGKPMSESSATLVMKADDKYVAIIRRGDTELNIEKTKQLLGVSNLKIASPDEFTKLTGLPSGAAHFLTGLPTFVDKKVLEKEYIYGGAGSLEITFKYKTSDLSKIPNSKTVDITQIKAKQIILTGDTPSGKLHLGHYVGTLENRVKLQHEYQTYILLANVHAYANDYTKFEKINKDVYDVYLDNLSVGIDPEVSTIYLESEIPETMELYSYFMTMVSHARAIRNPSVKEEIVYKKLDATMAFIAYPILQAADILGFKANLVPVGEDQSPVIEQTREIARDFNKAFGQTFAMPDAMIGRVARLIGTDGQNKMSKSGGNSILLSETEESLAAKIKSCYTDPNRIHATDPGKVEGNPVFEYHRAFNTNKEEVKDLEDRYRTGTVGDKEVKEKLFVALNNFLKPIREKRKFYEDRPEVAKEILMEGSKRARKVVAETLLEVKEKMGLLGLLKGDR